MPSPWVRVRASGEVQAAQLLVPVGPTRRHCAVDPASAVNVQETDVLDAGPAGPLTTGAFGAWVSSW